MRHPRRQLLAFLAIGLVLAAGLASTTAAPPPPPPEYGTMEGPVFLVISFDPAFAFDHPRDSETIMVNIGSLVGGSDVLDTRFIVDTALTGIVLPDGRRDPTFADLEQNAATVFGSFYALDEQGFHSVVPESGVVAIEIQEAIFEASNSGALDLLIAKKEYPTTTEIAKTITDFLPPGAPFTEDDIYDHIFGSGIQLSVTTTDGAIEGEGELFPYEPNSLSIFTFEFGVKKDGTYSQAISQQIPIKIQSTINIDDRNGALPVTIESGRGFDASQSDVASLTIAGVPVIVEQSSLTGNTALVAKFSVQALYDAGVLTTSTTQLTIRGTYTVTESDGTTETVHDWFGVDTVTVN